MALRNIVTEGDEILRKHAREVGEITPRTKEALDDMLETMRNAGGVGIAAPQVGLMKRMFVASPDGETVYYMIDPVMLEQEGSVEGDEGCLSVPGMIGTVVRPERIKIEATDMDGERRTYDFEGFDARVMCHEFDHLEGILYTDKAQNIREADYDDSDDDYDEEGCSGEDDRADEGNRTDEGEKAKQTKKAKKAE